MGSASACVVGRSSWHGVCVPTSGAGFTHQLSLWYVVRGYSLAEFVLPSRLLTLQVSTFIQQYLLLAAGSAPPEHKRTTLALVIYAKAAAQPAVLGLPVLAAEVSVTRIQMHYAARFPNSQRPTVVEGESPSLGLESKLS